MKKYISVLILVACLITGFLLITRTPVAHTPNNIKQVQIAGQRVRVDVALTSVEQEQGLSGRESLAENTGMLFVFEKPGKYPFWMKDMNFPIDIIWIGEDMKVVYIKKDARPELFPETYGPGADDKEAKYVLEVKSGFADKNNLQIGDTVLY